MLLQAGITVAGDSTSTTGVKDVSLWEILVNII